MQRSGGGVAMKCSMFQSSPAPKGRCNRLDVLVQLPRHQFQSSPAPKGRCNLAFQRAQGVAGFNPHRPRRADATRARRSAAKTHRCFNPHRPRRADATPPSGRSAPTARSFNPHRPRRADATRGDDLMPLPVDPFQSSPAPKGRCNHGRPARLRTRCRCFNPHRPRRADATASGW